MLKAYLHTQTKHQQLCKNTTAKNKRQKDYAALKHDITTLHQKHQTERLGSHGRACRLLNYSKDTNNTMGIIPTCVH